MKIPTTQFNTKLPNNFDLKRTSKNSLLFKIGNHGKDYFESNKIGEVSVTFSDKKALLGFATTSGKKVNILINSALATSNVKGSHDPLEGRLFQDLNSQNDLPGLKMNDYKIDTKLEKNRLNRIEKIDKEVLELIQSTVISIAPEGDLSNRNLIKICSTDDDMECAEHVAECILTIAAYAATFAAVAAAAGGISLASGGVLSILGVVGGVLAIAAVHTAVAAVAVVQCGQAQECVATRIAIAEGYYENGSVYTTEVLILDDVDCNDPLVDCFDPENGGVY